MDTTTFNLKYYKLYNLAKSRKYTILKTLILLNSIVLKMGIIPVEIMKHKSNVLYLFDVIYRHMSEDKDKIKRGVYYDTDDGCGSINDTYKQSHRILNTITLNDVKHLFR